MAAKHMKLLLAALALLLVLAATFAYADEGKDSKDSKDSKETEESHKSAEKPGSDEKPGDDSKPTGGESKPHESEPHEEDSSAKALSGKCDIEHCTTCNDANASVCDECEDKYKLENDATECKDGVAAPVRAAAVAACVAAVAMLAL